MIRVDPEKMEDAAAYLRGVMDDCLDGKYRIGDYSEFGVLAAIMGIMSPDLQGLAFLSKRKDA